MILFREGSPVRFSVLGSLPSSPDQLVLLSPDNSLFIVQSTSAGKSTRSRRVYSREAAGGEAFTLTSTSREELRELDFDDFVDSGEALPMDDLPDF